LMLGLFYYGTEGLEQNKIMAYEWLLKAARNGNENAQELLDMLCSNSPWACK